MDVIGVGGDVFCNMTTEHLTCQIPFIIETHAAKSCDAFCWHGRQKHWFGVF